MYCIIFTTFNKERAKTSDDAVEYARQNFAKRKMRCQGWLTSDDISLDVDWLGIGRGKFNYFPQNKCQSSGSDKNAVILTKDVYDEKLRVFEQNKNERPRVEWGHVDLEEEEVSRDFVGGKWIVVVDAHLA
ncbi:MAG TPA: hypothetical protein VJH55_02275 [Candidatus Paceibacterota bacterium]